MLSILHRYVFLELLRVFLLALFTLTLILTVVLLVAEAAQQGLPPMQILRLVPLVIPGTLPITIPTTTLFAVAVVYGRLAHDQELTAIKSSGVRISYVLWPALGLGVLLSIAVFFLYEEIVPRATHAFKEAALQDVEELLYARLKRDLCFQQPNQNYAIYVKEVQGRRLLNATFKKRDPRTGDELIAQAREAEISVNLERGEVIVTMRHGEMSHGQDLVVIDDQESFTVPLPADRANRLVRAREMTNSQLLRGLRDVEHDIQKSADDVVQLHGSYRHDAELATQNPVNFAHQATLRRKWEMQTEYATRPALAAGCFFFVLIGCPVAIWFHRRDYLSAFVTCFLPIIVVYYPLVMFGINLGKDGRLAPTLTLWAGDAVLGLVGLLLLQRLLRH